MGLQPPPWLVKDNVYKHCCLNKCRRNCLHIRRVMLSIPFDSAELVRQKMKPEPLLQQVNLIGIDTAETILVTLNT